MNDKREHRDLREIVDPLTTQRLEGEFFCVGVGYSPGIVEFLEGAELVPSMTLYFVSASDKHLAPQVVELDNTQAIIDDLASLLERAKAVVIDPERLSAISSELREALAHLDELFPDFV